MGGETRYVPIDAAHQGWIFPIGIPPEKLPVVTLAVGDRQSEIQKEDFGYTTVDEEMHCGGI